MKMVTRDDAMQRFVSLLFSIDKEWYKDTKSLATVLRDTKVKEVLGKNKDFKIERDEGEDDKESIYEINKSLRKDLDKYKKGKLTGGLNVV